jgi:hypothetical protein
MSPSPSYATVSQITQFQDGTIVAITTDGKIACKTSYDSKWDFNKLTFDVSERNNSTQFLYNNDSRLRQRLLMVDRGYISLSESGIVKDEKGEFKIINIGASCITQLKDGTIVVVNTIDGRVACKTSYDSEWDYNKLGFTIENYEAGGLGIFSHITQFQNDDIVGVTTSGKVLIRNLVMAEARAANYFPVISSDAYGNKRVYEFKQENDAQFKKSFSQRPEVWDFNTIETGFIVRQNEVLGPLLYKRPSIFIPVSSRWTDINYTSGLTQITQFQDGTIVGVASGRVVCWRKQWPQWYTDKDVDKVCYVSAGILNVSQITQLKDGTIVALTKDGKIACKTSSNSEWDFNKIKVDSGSVIKQITQFNDGTIVAVTTDGRVACKTSYDSEWDFNKLTSTGGGDVPLERFAYAYDTNKYIGVW